MRQEEINSQNKELKQTAVCIVKFYRKRPPDLPKVAAGSRMGLDLKLLPSSSAVGPQHF
jgi:hypothetical protein